MHILFSFQNIKSYLLNRCDINKMGDCLRKPSHRFRYPVLNETEETKLNEYLKEVDTMSPIEQDIRTAVGAMLERAVTGVNGQEVIGKEFNNELV